jgi:hypothetical protein
MTKMGSDANVADWIVFAISAFPNLRKHIMVPLRDGHRQT